MTSLGYTFGDDASDEPLDAAHKSRDTWADSEVYFSLHGGLAAGVALMKALCSNTTITSLTLVVDVAPCIDLFEQAMVAAFKSNCTLQSFTLWILMPYFRDRESPELLEALSANVTLQAFQMISYVQGISDEPHCLTDDVAELKTILNRNRIAWHMFRALSQVSRPSRDGFGSWADSSFRYRLVSFMLPTGCSIPLAMRDLMNSLPASDPDKPASPAQHPVEEDVDHGEEPAAARDEQLLQEQADHEWADGVAASMRAGTGSVGTVEALDHGNAVMSLIEYVLLFAFTRMPKELIAALLQGNDLKPARNAMREHGQECVLPSGAKIFVHPYQYSQVIEGIQSRDIQLMASHVLISESLRPSLEAILANVPCRKDARPKKHSPAPLMIVRARALSAAASSTSAASTMLSEQARAQVQATVEADSSSESDNWEWSVEPVRLIRVRCNAASVTQSTTEACGGGVNPRRLVKRARKA